METKEMESLIEDLFKALENENELTLILVEAKLHREADWVIPGTRHIY